MTVRTYRFQVVAEYPEHVVYESPDSYPSKVAASIKGEELRSAFAANHPEWTNSWVVVLTIDTQFTRVN